MRVLLDVSAVPSDPRGAGRYVSELARHLVAGATPDVEIVLLTRRDDAPRWRALGADAPDVGASVHAAVPGPRPVRLAWEQVAGPRVARRLGIDVWHGPHYTVPLHCEVPRVVTVHDLTLLEHPEWHERPKAFYFGHMIPAAVARAAVSVCVSRHTAARLDAVVPITPGSPPREVVVIPHGVDHARFRPEPDSRADVAALERVGVCAPYVAFLGTIEPRKDVPSLVRAFASVAAEHPELRLVLAGGDGWHDGTVDAAIATSGAADRVVRTGYVSDDVVPALLRRAAAVVYPSLEEGFGLPALEALACGAPLVTTAGSSIQEFVGDAALLVPPGDTDALVVALRRVLDPREGAALAARGPAQAAPYTWRAAAERHVEAYRRAAALRDG
ncbi:MAG: glycosyltransferase family 1 protein [Acidimicrobiia bacterium]